MHALSPNDDQMCIIPVLTVVMIISDGASRRSAVHVLINMCLYCMDGVLDLLVRYDCYDTMFMYTGEVHGLVESCLLSKLSWPVTE